MHRFCLYRQYMQPRAYSVFRGTMRRWFCCRGAHPDDDGDSAARAHDHFVLFDDDDEDEDLNQLDEDELERLINLNGGHMHRPSDASSVRFSMSEIFTGTGRTVSIGS